MAASAVEICNSALVLLGADRINALSDSTKEAILCNQEYSLVRDQLLCGHPWNFAITRVELSPLVSLPVGWEDNVWAQAFNLPADCLRVLEVDDNEGEWAVEGGSYLFANSTPVQIKYIKQVTNTSHYSKTFEKALALELAVKISYALTQSASLVEVLVKQRDKAVAEAKSFDAQEMSVQTVQANDWLYSRY